MSNQIIINKKLVDYLQKVGYRSDKLTDQLIQETQVLGNVAQMQIAPEQGQFLEMLVKISKASKCLEIGRFTGLSTLYIAKGLPDDGKVTTIDISDEFLDLSIKYWKLAEVDKKIDSIIGSGVEVMQSMIDRQDYFDLVFIDADKNNYPHYYELSLQLLPQNGIILIDNMLWHGDVADENVKDEITQTIRDLNLMVQQDQRVDYTLLPFSDGILFVTKK